MDPAAALLISAAALALLWRRRRGVWGQSATVTDRRYNFDNHGHE